MWVECCREEGGDGQEGFEVEREGSQSEAHIESDGSFEEVAVFGGIVSELREGLDWRGCPGTNRVGVVAVGKMIVFGMAISREMETCFFLLEILSTLVMPCIVDVGCLEDVRSK